MHIITAAILTVIVFCSFQAVAQDNDIASVEVTAFSIPKVANDTSGMPYALVAGGSKGIGYAIADALARRKYNLILIARGMDSLVSAKRRLEAAYPIKVEILSYDLSKEESAKAISDWCYERDIPLKMLCNVAGYGGARDYLTLSLDSLRYMSRINVESCMAMSLLLLPLLERNTPSYILNVASMAGFAPIPSKNMYAATKSAVIYFSHALRYQLMDKGISVSVLCPGPVYTKPQVIQTTRKNLGWFGDVIALEPAKVGEVAVKKTLKNKMVIVPGTVAKIASVVLRLLPKNVVVPAYYMLEDR